MVMKPEPLVRAVEEIRRSRGIPDTVVLLSPQGEPFTQADAVRLSKLSHIALLCGRYEGMDERVPRLVGAREISLGDFVVSGGELPAMIVVDAISRLVPGVVGDEQSVAEDSFARGLLDYPHYTRPAEFAGLKVPDVLLSGHHADVRRWRKKTALARTLDRRPDLIERARSMRKIERCSKRLSRTRPTGPRRKIVDRSRAGRPCRPAMTERCHECHRAGREVAD
jgi:tRNA (guanine37-N1)-methyltransferase